MYRYSVAAAPIYTDYCRSTGWPTFDTHGNSLVYFEMDISVIRRGTLCFGRDVYLQSIGNSAILLNTSIPNLCFIVNCFMMSYLTQYSNANTMISARTDKLF